MTTLRISLITVCFLTLALPSVAQQSSRDHIRWLGIENEYTSFQEIKPSLFNDSDSTIYVSGLYCYPYADIFRLNEKSSKWEPVFKSVQLLSRICDTTFPIRPRSALKVSVPSMGVFGYSGDTSNVYLHDGSIRPAIGTYRLGIIVASVPFTVTIDSSESIVLDSPQFRIIPTTSRN